jgi:hypothetical protein
MALPPSGPITMGMINTELGYPATQIISLNDAAVRALAQVPAGMISLSNFYGKSAVINKGFWIGGTYPTQSPVAVSNVSSIDFSSESISTLSNSPAGRTQAASTASKDNLYGIGGASALPFTPATCYFNTSKFSFSSQNYSTVAAYPIGSVGLDTAANADNAGYVANLGTPSPGVLGSSMFKFTYSSDTIAPIAAVPPIAPNYRGRGGLATPTVGYFAGGVSGPNTQQNTISKFTFASETLSAVTGTITSAKQGLTPFASPTFGYWTAGFPLGSTVANTINFSNDAIGTFTIAPGRGQGYATQTTQQAYIKGGEIPAAAPQTTYAKFTFSSGTWNLSFASISPTDLGRSRQMRGQPQGVAR